MRRFYITIVILHMLYAANLFLLPQSGQAIGSKGHIKRLGRVQRQATIHATGALRSTPTDSLDAHADLLPFQYLTEKLLDHTSTQIVSLPKSHLLAAHVNKAAKKYVKK